MFSYISSLWIRQLLPKINISKRLFISFALIVVDDIRMNSYRWQLIIRSRLAVGWKCCVIQKKDSTLTGSIVFNTIYWNWKNAPYTLGCTRGYTSSAIYVTTWPSIAGSVALQCHHWCQWSCVIDRIWFPVVKVTRHIGYIQLKLHCLSRGQAICLPVIHKFFMLLTKKKGNRKYNGLFTVTRQEFIGYETGCHVSETFLMGCQGIVGSCR